MAGTVRTFLQAAIMGDTSTISSMANDGADIEMCEGSGWTALTLATWYENTECVKELLKRCVRWLSPAISRFHALNHLLRRGADVESRDKNAWTPYHHACFGGWPDIVELLVEKGCDVAATNKDGKTGRSLAEAQVKSRCIHPRAECNRLTLAPAQGTLHAPLLEKLAALKVHERDTPPPPAPAPPKPQKASGAGRGARTAGATAAPHCPCWLFKTRMTPLLRAVCHGCC